MQNAQSASETEVWRVFMFLQISNLCVIRESDCNILFLIAVYSLLKSSLLIWVKLFSQELTAGIKISRLGKSKKAF